MSGHHLDLIANFCECNHAGHWLPIFWLQLRCCFRDLLRCAREPMAQEIAMQRIVFMSQTSAFSAKKTLIEQALLDSAVASTAAVAKKASGSDASFTRAQSISPIRFLPGSTEPFRYDLAVGSANETLSPDSNPSPPAGAS